ncbi:MAG: helix-turn-helix transcriptional regulator [Firmicutes bacterium]|nr:helix-turn-helix transcriptional regulator [Bacillota bacterium]
MRIFAIKNQKHKKRPAQSWLYYDEDNYEFSIKISKGADTSDLPLMLSCLAEKGEFEVGDKWARRFVQSRIIPPERQNLGAILLSHGLEYYDEFEFLMFDMGRCCHDDYYLEEIQETSAAKPYSYLVAEARNKAGLTQMQLAESSGIKQCNISRIENGAVDPSLETLEAIAKGLGKKLDIRFI